MTGPSTTAAARLIAACSRERVITELPHHQRFAFATLAAARRSAAAFAAIRES
jgi:hypothetical protein